MLNVQDVIIPHRRGEVPYRAGPPARNERRNFAALNGLTNLVVNAFLVGDNAAMYVVIVFILDHKSRARRLARLHERATHRCRVH